MGEEGGDCEPEGAAGCDAPVVADDEVPPERAERADVLHAPAPSGSAACRCRRSWRTSATDRRLRKPRMARIAASEPGQLTPAPSPPQKMPKLVRSSPTANLMVFSGTRSSGDRTAIPAITTSATAVTAAAAANAILPGAAPKVTTMNTISSPSSNTPLNATVNEYQSIAVGAPRPARVACSRSAANATPSSCSAL